MKLTRASGILLHPTAFPGPHGIGELGESAYQFIDFLAACKQSLWQILPLGPTGYGDSPYASFSSFAGNPLLISLDTLVRQGDLRAEDIANPPDFPPDHVDYGWVIHWKVPLLEKAARNFLDHATPERRADFEQFCTDHAIWLDDFAIFMAVKETFDRKAKAADIFGAMWSNYWPKDIALRRPKAVKKWQKTAAAAIDSHKVLQFFFFEQWLALRKYANKQGIRIIGDIPIFVAPDSVDVWANRDLFLLDKEGQPTVVAGVPPDYFSKTGQLWGNPLYNWPAIAETSYDWWTRRIAGTLQLVDILRIDHFRGFESYWEIPAGEKTAIKGRWRKGPGLEFFRAVETALGELPIIAEDLGIITDAVTELRENFGLPGMKVLQFAFDLDKLNSLETTNPFLPHNYEQHCVVYTGTHDNDTTRGWYETRSPEEQDIVRRYLARDDQDIVWHFIRLAQASSAGFAVIPFQDVLDLGSEARMNIPSTIGGNWAWRYHPEVLSDWVISRLETMTTLYGRNPEAWQKKVEKKPQSSQENYHEN